MRRPTGRAEFREPCAAMAMAMAGLLGWVNGFRLHELLFVPAARGKCRLSLVALQDGWESLWVSLLVSSVAGYGLFRDAVMDHSGLGRHMGPGPWPSQAFAGLPVISYNYKSVGAVRGKQETINQKVYCLSSSPSSSLSLLLPPAPSRIF